MEATAKHDFVATAPDELSFTKGATLKIISNNEDENWYKAELSGSSGFVPSNYIHMKPAPWFVGRISRQQAEDLLLEKNDSNQFMQRDGAFLVRNSENFPGEFSISVKFADGVQHFKVMRDAGKYYLWQVKFDSLNQLVTYHRTSSVSRTQTIYLQEMSRPKVIANYDFKPENPEELEIRRGDIIHVLNKNDPNWWMGEITRGNAQASRGLFPMTYVSPYTD